MSWWWCHELRGFAISSNANSSNLTFGPICIFAQCHFVCYNAFSVNTLFMCFFHQEVSETAKKVWRPCPVILHTSDDCQVVGCLENHAMSIQTDEVSDWIFCWWDNRVALFGLFFTPLPRTGELHTILNAPHNIRTRLKNFSSKNTWKEEQIWHKKNQWTLSEQWLIFYKFAL